MRETEIERLFHFQEENIFSRAGRKMSGREGCFTFGIKDALQAGIRLVDVYSIRGLVIYKYIYIYI